MDKAATAITGGEVLWSGDLVGSGQNKSPSLANQALDFDIPNGSEVTLCVATFANTSTVASGFRIREEW